MCDKCGPRQLLESAPGNFQGVGAVTDGGERAVVGRLFSLLSRALVNSDGKPFGTSRLVGLLHLTTDAESTMSGSGRVRVVFGPPSSSVNRRRARIHHHVAGKAQETSLDAVCD